MNSPLECCRKVGGRGKHGLGHIYPWGGSAGAGQLGCSSERVEGVEQTKLPTDVQKAPAEPGIYMYKPVKHQGS